MRDELEIGMSRKSSSLQFKEVLLVCCYYMYSSSSSYILDTTDMDLVDSALTTDLMPRVLLMGARRSGKTSIQRVVFNKMSPHEVLILYESIVYSMTEHTYVYLYGSRFFSGFFRGKDCTSFFSFGLVALLFSTSTDTLFREHQPIRDQDCYKQSLCAVLCLGFSRGF